MRRVDGEGPLGPKAPMPGDAGWRDYVLTHATDRRPGEAVGGNASLLDQAFSFHMSNLRVRPTLDVDVVGHCNLDCACCCHFSPISEPCFLELGEYERDLALLARIDGVEGFFAAICLMGGEPLLHPDLADFVLATRRHLPQVVIRLVTNGLLLEGSPPALWGALRDTGAEVLVTPYPIGLDYDRLAALTRERGVRAFVGGGLAKNEDGGAYFLRTPLDPAGLADPVESFVSCPLAGTIMQLRDGRIYPCNRGALLDRLNSRFGTDLSHEPADYLELASIHGTADIDAFRRTPKPMCRYCAQALTTRVAWRRSCRAAEEWLVTEEERG